MAMELKLFLKQDQFTKGIGKMVSFMVMGFTSLEKEKTKEILMKGISKKISFMVSAIIDKLMGTALKRCLLMENQLEDLK